LTKVRPWPYEELAHTPMLLRGPGIKAGQRIRAFVQSCDVAPTVCEWLGIGLHPDMQGKSLLPLVRGEVDKVRDFAVAGYHGYSWGMFTDDWSYVHWLQPENKDSSKMAATFYSESTDCSHIKATGGKGYMEEWVSGMAGDEAELSSSSIKASLDGASQWTCSPNSVAEVPEGDELYDRRKDPFQLNNVLDKHPDMGKELLQKLKEFMGELMTS
jgi:hypothetical protein